MRILHVLPSADPKSGGPIEAVRQQAELFAARGHALEVATLDSPELAARWNFPAPLIGLGPCAGGYGYTSKMTRWLSANLPRFNLLVIDGIWQYNALAAYRAVKQTEIPYVVFTHGMLDPYFKKQFSLKHLKKSIYYTLVLHDILSNAKAVFFTAEDEKILARKSFKHYSVRERVVPFGIAEPKCDLINAGSAFLDRFPALRGKRLALSLGRIHPKKGIDLLIDAFASTLASDRNWQLVIAGPDQIGWKKKLDGQAVKRGIGNRITWTGMLEDEWKWGAFAAAEVFVIPSHQENFGVVVAEALAAGLPVLMSNKVNIWREVASCSAGFVEPDTLEGAIQLFRLWANSSVDQTESMRRNAIRCFRQYFDLNTVGDKMVEIFEEIAGTNTSFLATSR